MHALTGLRRGYQVTQLERDVMPRGASVRNFGLIWVSGRSTGRELNLALRARELWEDIAKSCPQAGFRPHGSLTVAQSKEELAVLEEVINRPDASDRGFTLLTPDQARTQNPALRGEFIGALSCDKDAIVEPRLTLGALRERLSTFDAYEWIAGREVVDVRAHAVRDQMGEWHEGDMIVCCIGANPLGVLGQALMGAPLRRVRLQMLETAPSSEEITTALADGDSLRYYPAFKGQALDDLPPQGDLAARWATQLLLVKRLAGHLTIGDTHSYEEPFPFDIDDRPVDHLLGAARGLLGAIPPVERRWSGVYSQVTDPNLMYLRHQIDDGVAIVTGPGGRGMTMSPAIAEETFL
jgi:FAD dependent oxidoreductase TIGR03364